jgi:hypothetical protein
MSHRSSVELLEYARLTLELIERHPGAKKMLTNTADWGIPT